MLAQAVCARWPSPAGTTATKSDVLAILEPDEDVEVMLSGVFNPQCAMSGTAHDPCGAEVAAVESEGGCWTADPSAASTAGRRRRLDRHLGRRYRERKLRRC